MGEGIEEQAGGAGEGSAASNDAYEAMASSIAAAPLRGRSGFGALRQFDEILRESMRLVIESGFFVHPKSSDWPVWGFADPEFWHFFFRRRPRGNHRFLIEGLLRSPANYSPPCVWALFWGLAKAEHEFLSRYVPFWSHEERLTGHLVSQMIERLEEFGPHWRDLGDAGPGETGCRLWYADTATARQEKLTGADLGVIVHAKFPGAEEYLKVVRFQAKKVGRSGSATIDLDQVEALLQRESFGYYLFYHFPDGKKWALPPTVQPASRFSSQLEKAKQEPSKRGLGRITENARNDGFDLATFITFGVVDEASDHGVLASTPEEAIATVLSGPGAPPSRVLVITLGGGMAIVDWPHLSQEFIGYQFGDE